MNWLVLALLLLLPGSVEAKDHISEGLCDEIVSILREYRAYTELTPAQVERLAGSCYGEVDQINEESRSGDNTEEGT